MAAKNKKALQARDKAGPDATPDIWSKATGSDHHGIRMARVGEIVSVLWTPPDAPKEEQEKNILAAFHMFAELKPQNGVEGMLATQMVATHSAAMECLRRAMIPDQPSEVRDLNLKNANKLLQTFTRQLEVLDKYRGKGQQKITVEHVTVQAGGQAIVGNVSSPAPAHPAQDGPRPMLGHQPADLMPIIKDVTPANKPVKSRSARSGSKDPE